MDSEINLLMQRAEDEILLSRIDMEVSLDNELKKRFGVPENRTFFHSVISHAYYSIFNSAKAYLFSKGIKIFPPKEHQKTFDKFKEFVEKGQLNKELLEIYESEVMKAESLLIIFKSEKKKRGKFTYDIKSKVNLPHAQISIDNARTFIKAISQVVTVS